jgi:hypothetical protein
MSILASLVDSRENISMLNSRRSSVVSCRIAERFKGHGQSYQQFSFYLFVRYVARLIVGVTHFIAIKPRYL